MEESEAASLRSSRLTRALIGALGDITVFVFDRDERVIVAEGGAMTVLTWFDESLYVGRTADELYEVAPKPLLDIAVPALRDAVTSRARRDFELSDAGRAFNISIVPIEDGDGDLEFVLAIGKDITRGRRNERELDRRSHQQEVVAKLAHHALASESLDELHRRAAKEIGHGLGLDEERTYGLLREGRVLEILDDDQQSFGTEDVYFLQAVANLSSAASERLRKEAASRFAALHDPLTKLSNRTVLIGRLGRALARHRRSGAGVMVLLIDIDRFKLINDSFGHLVGDAVLIELARRLEAVARDGDTVARLSGDEFVLVCEGVSESGEAMEIASRIEAEIARPVTLTDGDHHLSASIGIAVANGSASDPDSLLRDADIALYRAKNRGRAGYEIFDDKMRQEILERIRIEREIAHSDLVNHYQPIFDLETGRPVAVEALVRWQHPTRGLVMPDEFIGIAEETGKIADITCTVLDDACRAVRRWRDEHNLPIRVFINVSGRELADPGFVDTVLDKIDAAGLSPDAVGIEVTERVLISQAETSADELLRLRDAGVHLNLDDFGTGYSSLVYLKHFPISGVKIDRQLTADLAVDDRDRAIARAILEMGAGLGIDTVAEGIETARQADILVGLGFRLGQGFHLARPMNEEATTAFLLEATVSKTTA